MNFMFRTADLIKERYSENHIRKAIEICKSPLTQMSDFPTDIFSSIRFYVNGKTVEENFGILNALTKEQWLYILEWALDLK